MAFLQNEPPIHLDGGHAYGSHNLWATRRLEMQKLDADGECNSEVMGVVVQETR